MLAAPFPILRTAHVFTPSIYAGFITWTLVGANPLMIALAYTFDDKPKIEWQTAATALGATTARVCGRRSGRFRVDGESDSAPRSTSTARWRSTFANTSWNERTTLRHPTGKIDTDCDPRARASHGMHGYARCYWPMDLVEPFVRENWCVAGASFSPLGV